jgi:diguanylate cyclase (GGDEF)-like protein
MQSRQKYFDEIRHNIDQSNQDVAFIIVKLKRFKEINTTYGFLSGDKMLEHIAQRLREILRPVDLIGRIGDNEFGLMLPAINNTSHALLATNKVLSEFKTPVQIDGAYITPELVLGVAVKPEHGKDFDSLLHAATLALQSAEKNNEEYALHETSGDEFPPSLILQNEIQFALEDDEFELYCQPKVSLSSGKLYGGESLIRWNSSKYGFINTQYFIDILESSRSLLPVTHWVLNGAIRQCIRYQQVYPGFTIAVNLSPSLLTDRSIVEIVSNIASVWSISPSSLLIEVTEGAMMLNPKKSLEILNEFHQLGLGISIDDFGTGYSSLAYLKHLPVDEIKIDKSFVMNMSKDKKDSSIVKSAVDLAHNLDLKVVAEGVEDEETMELLALMGCDYAQGYYLAKPMPFESLLAWIEESDWT